MVELLFLLHENLDLKISILSVKKFTTVPAKQRFHTYV